MVMELDQSFTGTVRQMISHFLVRAFMAGILTVIGTSLTGVHVVLRRMAFFGDGVAHIAFAAAAIGTVLGFSSFLTALLLSIFVSIVLGYLSQKGIHEDTGIGILFSLSMAVGIILFSIKNERRSLMSYMFGDILAVSRNDLFLLAVISLIVVVFTILWKDKLIYMSFDREFVKVTGVKTESIYYTFLAILAATIVIAVRTVGVVLVSAFLITPTAAASIVAKDFRRIFLLAPIFGIITVVAGITASIWIDVPVGSMIVVVQSLFFFALLLFKR